MLEVLVLALLLGASLGQQHCLPGQEECGLTCCAVNSGATCCNATSDPNNVGCAPPGVLCCRVTDGYCNSTVPQCCLNPNSRHDNCAPENATCCPSDARGWCDGATEQCCPSAGCAPKEAECCGSLVCSGPSKCCGRESGYYACVDPAKDTCCNTFVCPGTGRNCSCGVCYDEKTEQCCSYRNTCSLSATCCGLGWYSRDQVCCKSGTVCCSAITGSYTLNSNVCADPATDFCCTYYDASSVAFSTACPVGTLCCPSQSGSAYGNDGCCAGHMAVNSTCGGMDDSCPYSAGVKLHRKRRQ